MRDEAGHSGFEAETRGAKNVLMNERWVWKRSRVGETVSSLSLILPALSGKARHESKSCTHNALWPPSTGLKWAPNPVLSAQRSATRASDALWWGLRQHLYAEFMWLRPQQSEVQPRSRHCLCPRLSWHFGHEPGCSGSQKVTVGSVWVTQCKPHKISKKKKTEREDTHPCNTATVCSFKRIPLTAKADWFCIGSVRQSRPKATIGWPRKQRDCNRRESAVLRVKERDSRYLWNHNKHPDPVTYFGDNERSQSHHCKRLKCQPTGFRWMELRMMAF